MNYKIVSKNNFKVAGVAKTVSMAEGESLSAIPMFWKETVENGLISQISRYASPQIFPAGVKLGVCTDFTDDHSEFAYIIAVETLADHVDCCDVIKAIPALDWAVFESVGPMPDSIQSVWKAIFSDFFVNEPYVHAEGPELEVYPPGDTDDPAYWSEVWIPVRRI